MREAGEQSSGFIRGLMPTMLSGPGASICNYFAVTAKSSPSCCLLNIEVEEQEVNTMKGMAALLAGK